MALSFVSLGTSTWAHSWYPPECCSGHDCRPVPCEALTEIPQGVRFTTLGITYRKDQIRASQDSMCHVCYSTYRGVDGKETYTPHCVFIQLGF